MTALSVCLSAPLRENDSTSLSSEHWLSESRKEREVRAATFDIELRRKKHDSVPLRTTRTSKFYSFLNKLWTRLRMDFVAWFVFP